MMRSCWKKKFNDFCTSNQKCCFMTFKSFFFLGLTAVCVGFGSVTVVESTSPCPFVPCGWRCWLANAIATLEPLGPLAPVEPPATCLHSKTMAFSVLPLTLVRRTARANMWMIRDEGGKFDSHEPLNFIINQNERSSDWTCEEIVTKVRIFTKNVVGSLNGLISDLEFMTENWKGLFFDSKLFVVESEGFVWSTWNLF